MFYRLIKPDWAKPTKANGETNPDFVQEIQGPDVIEDYNLSPEFLAEKNGQGYNLYFFPNHPDRNVYTEGVKHLSGKHISVFNFVFVDMDLKDGIYETKEAFFEVVSKFPVKPTMVVNSGNGVHVYWRINGLTRDQYVFTQLALIQYFKTDKSIYTVLQLMRLPGYDNTKKFQNYHPASIVEELSSGDAYDLTQFPEDVFTLPEATIIRGQNHINKLDGKIKVSVNENVNLDELPDSFVEFIEDPRNVASYNLFTSPKETYGDRSGADMKLANILYRQGFNKKEALAVLSNTEKALSKGPHRYSYAQNTIDKVYVENSKYPTVADRLRLGENNQHLGDPVQSTWYFDTAVLGNPWRKKEVLGLIAGSGVGKTSVSLKWIKDSIENNKDNDDIYIFFTLEMTEAEIVDRWIKLVGTGSPLAERLYVIGNEDHKGNPRNIGLQEIQEIGEDIKKHTGKNIGMIVVDHIGIISKHIDTRKKHTFGIQSEIGAGWSEIRTLGLSSVATQMKTLAKMLDTFIVVLTQTTKGKGDGWTPIDKDGAFGISQYENIMDRIVTIWRPLLKLESETKTRFMAWQYVKIRNQHVGDQIRTYEPKLLVFDLGTGDLRLTLPDEYKEFQELYPKVQALLEAQSKKKDPMNYSILVSKEAQTKTLQALGIVQGGSK